jgi:hypothetical protein
MKKIVLILLACVLFFSCCSKKIVSFTTVNNLKVSINFPRAIKPTNLDAMVKSDSNFASGMLSSTTNWKGFIDGDYYIFILWPGKGISKDIFQLKGATETAYQGSENLLRSEIINVNGQAFYINAAKGNGLFRIKASTYIDSVDFAVVIECKEKDFPEAQKKLMEIIETLKVE